MRLVLITLLSILFSPSISASLGFSSEEIKIIGHERYRSHIIMARRQRNLILFCSFSSVLIPILLDKRRRPYGVHSEYWAGLLSWQDRSVRLLAVTVNTAITVMGVMGVSSKAFDEAWLYTDVGRDTSALFSSSNSSTLTDAFDNFHYGTLTCMVSIACSSVGLMSRDISTSSTLAGNAFFFLGISLVGIGSYYCGRCYSLLCKSEKES